ncbi:MAG TPA: peptide-methionine (S)-S-oxide reductase MsrA [Sphingomicrobium sp.]|nr:peptide-methionine (S)-S-oxide reductase MsrA [Sphingomicrobium sp.]
MNRFVDLALSAVALLGASAAAAPQPQLQTAVLAGGCFWGMEAVFEHVKGVKDVVSGFAGGSAKDATYASVSSESTGHAEAVKITYDPSQISYFDLLKIYFTVAHDPTQVNRQGPDTGPSYRSAIFPQDVEQKAVATKTVAQLKAMGKPIATRIESGSFYPAEGYHQDYVRKHPDAGYVVVNDLPKLEKLKSHYPNWWRA